MTAAEPWPGYPGDPLSGPVPEPPEDRTVFRLAQLALLLDVAAQVGAPIRTIDRLGLYDFLAANPYIATSGGENRDNADRLTLRLAGFSDMQLSYASAGQRFANRRRRLQHDMALLVAYKLATFDHSGYLLTDAGHNIARQLNSVYADAYRTSADLILRKLGRLSDRRLNAAADQWLGQSWLLIDFLEDIREAVPGSTAPRGEDQIDP
jgi:hypothetical protein